MSNDPNRIVQQHRSQRENKSHNTMETYQVEKSNAPLPGWQQNILYVLAFIGVIAIIVAGLAVLGVI
jgi:hypothetical protein